MKLMLALIATVGLGLCGCDDKPDREVTLGDVKDKAAETLDTAKQLATQEQSKAAQRLRVRYDAIDAKIKGLEVQAGKATGEAKTRMQAQIDKLEKQRQEIGNKLEDLKDDGADAWESAKDGLDKALGDLEDAYDDAKAAFD